jgi:hypothetical protein
MHRQILEACLPFAIVLIVAFGLLHLTIRLSPASWNWRRIKDLHRSEEGGVQSLSLVLTLPFFVSLISLIVQVSQVIIGMIGVHYAAYAGVRSAAVWLPAEVKPAAIDTGYFQGEAPNYVDAQLRDYSYPPEPGYHVVVDSSALPSSVKYRKVWSATILALTPFGPSRDRGLASGTVWPDMKRVPPIAGVLMEDLAGYDKATGRIDRKLSYVEQNTRVFLEWRHAARSNGILPVVGPTYNPWNHDNPEGNPALNYDPHRVGWQDPVTVHVYYRMPMLPGPGRVLARLVNWKYPDRSRHFSSADAGFFDKSSTKEDPGALVLHASATMNNDGLIPLYREGLDEY